MRLGRAVEWSCGRAFVFGCISHNTFLFQCRSLRESGLCSPIPSLPASWSRSHFVSGRRTEGTRSRGPVRLHRRPPPPLVPHTARPSARRREARPPPPGPAFRDGRSQMGRPARRGAPWAVPHNQRALPRPTGPPPLPTRIAPPSAGLDGSSQRGWDTGRTGSAEGTRRA